MGGSGSGNRNQSGARRRVESCQSIDVREWQRGGYLTEGGFHSKHVGVTIAPGYLTLTYHWTWRDGQTERMSTLVPLTKTACNFGNHRYWFICPSRKCNRRAAILYLAGGRFACRHCHRLAYRTQHENFFDRGLLKAQRIRMKLGGSADMTLPFPPKPKHMQWRKYYRLKDAAQRGEMRSMVGLRAWIDSLKRTVSR